MRTLALAVSALLSACGEAAQENMARPEAPAAAVPSAAEDRRIECAVGGGGFERSCTIETRESAEGLVVVLRSADGGFRRLLLPRDGSGAVAADGAEPATVTGIGDGRAEVAIGGDRYRLSATLGPSAR